MATAKDLPKLAAKDSSFSRRLEFNLPETKMSEIYAEDQQKVVSAPLRSSDNKSAQAAIHNAQRATPNTQLVDGPENRPEATAEPTATVARRPRRTDVATRKKPKQPNAMSGDKPRTVVRLVFGIPADLTERASAWAEKARCPVNIIIQRIFADLRPELLEKLEAGIRRSDVNYERATDTMLRFNTSVTISSDAHKRLTAELDPEGIAGLGPLLTTWVRERTLKRLDAVLSEKGY